jgi:hypothetical protein
MHIYGRRLYGGGFSQAAVGAQYSFVALYNNSTIGRILRVVEYLTGSGGTSNVVAFFAQGTVGSSQGAGVALFSGEQSGAGAIYAGSNATAPGFGINMNAAGSVTIGSRDMPWFYIRPGFSVVFKGDTVNQMVNATFWWEDLEMSMLNPYELQ